MKSGRERREGLEQAESLFASALAWDKILDGSHEKRRTASYENKL